MPDTTTPSAGKAIDQKLRWAILGTGNIARKMAAAIARSQTASLAMVASRRGAPENPHDFFGATIVSDYETALQSPDIDAVYIALPHHLHAHWAIKCCAAKKHVLCEKPIAINTAQTKRVIQAARENGVFLGEGAMYRLQPHTRHMLEVLEQGAIGQINMIASSIGTNASEDDDHWQFDPARAGGSILNIGFYPVSISRLIAGISDHTPFVDPVELRGLAQLTAKGVDARASAVMLFKNGVIAEVSSAMTCQRPVALQVFGTNGRLEFPNFWSGSGNQGGTGLFTVIPHYGEAYEVQTYENRWLFEVEVDEVAKAVFAGQTEFSYPGMSWADSLGNMQTLDHWRNEVGVRYSFEVNG